MYFLDGERINIKLIFKLYENPEEEQLELTLPENTTVKQLISILIDKEQISPDKISLRLDGKPLIDVGKKLKEFQEIKIKPVSVIFPQSKLGSGPSIGFEYNSLKNHVIKKFSKSAPDYRIVKKGLCLDAKCKNQNCIAYNQTTVVNKGMGVFNIAVQMHECRCPMCNTETLPSHNIGFYKTRLFIKGKRQGQPKIEQNLVADDRDYHTFKNGPSQTVRWNYLVITAKQL